MVGWCSQRRHPHRRESAHLWYRWCWYAVFSPEHGSSTVPVFLLIGVGRPVPPGGWKLVLCVICVSQGRCGALGIGAKPRRIGSGCACISRGVCTLRNGCPGILWRFGVASMLFLSDGNIASKQEALWCIHHHECWVHGCTAGFVGAATRICSIPPTELRWPEPIRV